MALTDSDTVNYRGELFAYGKKSAPFLAAIGGKAKRSSSISFPCGQTYQVTAGSASAISETTSKSAVTPDTVAPDQVVNVAEIHMEQVEVTFVKQITTGTFSGINVNGDNPKLDELGFQKKFKLRKIANDLEYSIFNGVYVAESTAAVIQKSRGFADLVTTNTVAGEGLKLSKEMIEELVREMLTSGAPFEDVVLWANAFNMQMLSDIYGYAPQDRKMGGVAIDSFLVPGAGQIRVAYSPQVPDASVFLAEMSVCSPVFVPMALSPEGKIAPSIDNLNGVDVLWQPTAVVAASQGGFLFTMFGFDHGPEMYHGSITGLATSA
jgi:hypothetical protein